MAIGLILTLVALALLAGTIVARALAGRLPRSLVVQYTPARGASVLADAVLLGQERRAATAALLDLAVRRRVRLFAERTGGRRPAVAVEVLDAPLTAADIALLDALFDGGEGDGRRLRRFSKDARRTSARVRALVERYVKHLRSTGMLAADGLTGGLLRIAARILAGASILVALVALLAGALPASGLAVLALGTAVAADRVGARIPARRFTAAARPAREHLDGLRQYMTLAEADRIRTLQSPEGAEREPAGALDRLRLHERLLPYAVLFGIEREWLRVVRVDYELVDRQAIDAVEALDAVSDLLILASALGDLADLAAAVGGLADGAGGLLEAAGSVGDLFDWAP